MVAGSATAVLLADTCASGAAAPTSRIGALSEQGMCWRLTVQGLVHAGSGSSVHGVLQLTRKGIACGTHCTGGL